MAELKNIRIAISGIYDYTFEELEKLGLSFSNAPDFTEKKAIYKVYRPATVLASAVDKFKMLPLTHHHPRNPVDEKNFRELTIGFTDSNPFVDYLEDKNEVGIRSTALLYDSEALTAYERGEIQLSPGYFADFEWQNGVSPNGEKYDIIMKEIKDVNHLALLPNGRGGNDAVVLDSRKNIFDIVREQIQKDGAPEGNDNASKEHKKAGENLKSLDSCIDKILNGTEKEKEDLQRSYFKIAETPQELKDKGLRGDYFTIKYGVISHHKNKDSDHNLSKDEWKQICEKIKNPLAVVPYKDSKDSFNLYLDLKHNGKNILVGVTVKNAGRNLEVNAVNTVFAKGDVPTIDKAIFVNKKITPDQRTLLAGTNPQQYSVIRCSSNNLSQDSLSRKTIFEIVQMNIFDQIRYGAI